MTSVRLRSTVARVLVAVLLAVTAVVASGCGSSLHTTGWEEKHPLQQCDTEDYEETHLVGCITAASFQPDLAREKVLVRGAGRLAVQVKQSIGRFANERREEIEARLSGENQTRQMSDSLETAVVRATAAVLSGVTILRSDTFHNEDKGTFRVDAWVGLPIGESASEWAQRVRQNPTLQEAFDDESELKSLLQAWLHWSLRHDLIGGGGDATTASSI